MTHLLSTFVYLNNKISRKCACMLSSLCGIMDNKNRAFMWNFILWFVKLSFLIGDMEMEFEGYYSWVISTQEDGHFFLSFSSPIYGRLELIEIVSWVSPVWVLYLEDGNQWIVSFWFTNNQKNLIQDRVSWSTCFLLLHSMLDDEFKY